MQGPEEILREFTWAMYKPPVKVIWKISNFPCGTQLLLRMASLSFHQSVAVRENGINRPIIFIVMELR